LLRIQLDVKGLLSVARAGWREQSSEFFEHREKVLLGPVRLGKEWKKMLKKREETSVEFSREEVRGNP
jgi:hypothetical protein